MILAIRVRRRQLTGLRPRRRSVLEGLAFLINDILSDEIARSAGLDPILRWRSAGRRP
jgi:hypothetical protein